MPDITDTGPLKKDYDKEVPSTVSNPSRPGGRRKSEEAFLVGRVVAVDRAVEKCVRGQFVDDR